jgi:hypothetical protein
MHRASIAAVLACAQLAACSFEIQRLAHAATGPDLELLEQALKLLGP